MTSTAVTYLERALDEARRAAEALCDDTAGDPFFPSDAEAIEDAIRTVRAIRDRIDTEPILDGRTRMIPAAGLRRRDRIVHGDGASVETVRDAQFHFGDVEVEIQGRDGVAYAIAPGDLVEVTA